MKITTIIMLLVTIFVTSCNKHSESTYPKNSKAMTKHDEILRIMRDHAIIRHENMNNLRVEERRELLRMKKDFYVKVSDPNLVLTIPGPGWEIKGPLSIVPFRKTTIDKEYKENDPTNRWLEFINNFKEGDELYYYKSDKLSWSYLRGLEGYVIIRNNRVLDKITTAMN